MWLSFYNPVGVGDTVLLMKKEGNRNDITIESKGNVTRIALQESNETIGYNVFEASSIVKIDGNGPVTLTKDQVEALNNAIQAAGFEEPIEVDATPKIVVGYVKECVPHEDSDHLSITQVDVGGDRLLQIVCGAANVKAGEKVVVATPGAVMPDGLIIWPGELRGVKSEGMLCSAKELRVENPTGQKGILLLPPSATVGEPFFQ